MERIENIMSTTLTHLKEVIDANNVIGTPIVGDDGIMVIPISKISLGFVTGGGEYSETNPKLKINFPMAGGSGGGVTITPIGFLVLGKEKNFITVNANYEESKWVTLIKGIVDKCKKGE